MDRNNCEIIGFDPNGLVKEESSDNENNCDNVGQLFAPVVVLNLKIT